MTVVLDWIFLTSLEKEVVVGKPEEDADTTTDNLAFQIISSVIFPIRTRNYTNVYNPCGFDN